MAISRCRWRPIGVQNMWANARQTGKIASVTGMLSYPHPAALDAGGLFRCGMLTGYSWRGRGTV